MPRRARKKTVDSIFHIMCRSIKEVPLFVDDADKYKYIQLIKHYRKTYRFKVYGYCFMDNHVHLIIDANGADISTIMHGINFNYAQYYNAVHDRYGHLFQDRFKSKIVTSDRYLIALSAYIHNNALDLPGYGDCPEAYLFSSLGVYVGMRNDPFGLVDTQFVLSMFGRNSGEAQRQYIRLVYKTNCKEFKKTVEFENEGTEYRSGRVLLVRNATPENVIDYIIKNMGVTRLQIFRKYSRNMTDVRAMAVYMMRCLGNQKCRDICRVLGNITQKRVSDLSSLAVKLLNDKRFSDFLEGFMIEYKCI